MQKRNRSLHIRPRSRLRISRAIVIVLLALLYAVIFIPQYEGDIVLIPTWVSDDLLAGAVIAIDPVPTAPLAVNGDDSGDGSGDGSGDDNAGAVVSPIPFHYNMLFGYISADGAITTPPLVPIPYGVAHSRTLYSPYLSVNHPIHLYASDGNLVRTIDRHGYPVIDGERVFVLHQNGSTVSEWSREGGGGGTGGGTGGGEERWRRDFGSIISAIDSTQTLSALSFFDGTVVILDEAGRTVGQFAYPFDDSAVFSAVAISDDRRLCVVYEAVGQRLMVFELEGATFRASAANPPQVVDVRSDVAPQRAFPYVDFLPHSNHIVYFNGTDLYLYDVARSQLRLLHQMVELVDIDANNEYMAIITRSVAQTVLSVYSQDGIRFARFPLKDFSTVSDHFVRFSDPHTLSLLIGIENMIISLRQEERL